MVKRILILKVLDTGIGVKNEDKSKLFELLWMVSEVRKDSINVITAG
jgi:signal transduction histidine kinase